MVLDEPTSALDVSVQAQIINLLRRIQRAVGARVPVHLARPGGVSLIADRVAVMYLGRIVEIASKEVVLASARPPVHAGTDLGGPGRTSSEKRERITMRGEPLSPIDPPARCHLVSRCPFAQPICSEVPAELVEVSPGHATRCVRFQREHQNGSWNPTPEPGGLTPTA